MQTHDYVHPLKDGAENFVLPSAERGGKPWVCIHYFCSGISAEYERVMKSKLSEFEGRLGMIGEKLMSVHQVTKEPNYLVQLRQQITEVDDTLKRSCK